MWVGSWLLGLAHDSQLLLTDVFRQLLLSLLLLFSVYYFFCESEATVYCSDSSPFQLSTIGTIYLLMNSILFLLPLSVFLPISLILCPPVTANHFIGVSIRRGVENTAWPLFVYLLRGSNHPWWLGPFYSRGKAMCLHSDIIEVTPSSWMNELLIQLTSVSCPYPLLCFEKAATVQSAALCWACGSCNLFWCFSWGVTQHNLWKATADWWVTTLTLPLPQLCLPRQEVMSQVITYWAWCPVTG